MQQKEQIYKKVNKCYVQFLLLYYIAFLLIMITLETLSEVNKRFKVHISYIQQCFRNIGFLKLIMGFKSIGAKPHTVCEIKDKISSANRET